MVVKSLGMTLYFGIELDDLVYPRTINQGEKQTHGDLYMGPRHLLNFLEQQLGLTGHPDDIDYLRIEQYRQALTSHLTGHEESFYKNSFEADEFATAATLLARRDELLMTGWDFIPSENMPKRLKTLFEIENIYQDHTTNRVLGYADRIVEAIASLYQTKPLFSKIFLNEPFSLLPTHFQHLFNEFKSQKIPIIQLEIEQKEAKTDLAIFKKILQNQGEREKLTLNGDGSLILFKAKRETEAAAYLAQLLRLNPNLRPACLIPEKNRVLDTALMYEGLPSMGILSASLARPTLQILKLVSAFLWNPIDPYKIMEFVSLAVKPLNPELAYLIAEEMAQSPGLNGDKLNAIVYNFFLNLEEQAKDNKHIKVKTIRKEYEFWFKRKRYDISEQVPKEQVIPIFKHLTKWAISQFEESGSKDNSLLVLYSQSQKIEELLLALPDTETHLSALQLERIVRTIYEPSPIRFTEIEVGHLSYIHHSSALIDSVEELLWWNFLDIEKEYHFSHWYPQELEYLNANHVFPETPAKQNERLLWRRLRPILHTQKRLILVIPEKVNGAEVQPHSLLGDLLANFSNPEAISYHIGQKSKSPILQYFIQPNYHPVKHKKLGQPPPYLKVSHVKKFEQREEESFSSLNTLFYYPYQWVFKHKIKLRKSSILSVIPERRLMGNLAHHLFEQLFKQENVLDWSKEQINNWVNKRMHRLLEQEGAVLLMYGREPERVNFENTIKYAIWALLRMIRSNRWEINEVEHELKGPFRDVTLKGVADLVLKRGNEMAIVDLKWGGAAFRRRTIKNKEDLQLILYADLLKNGGNWAHTAYFIIDSGKMIARNQLAFKEAEAVMPESDYEEINTEILSKMQATYDWRLSQLQKGLIEIRTEHTIDDMEEQGMTLEEIDKLLEMKEESARFDDYQSLVNLVE